MGIESDLREIFSFVYKAIFGNLTEYEFDHVFVGKFDGTPILNKEEVEDWKWIKPEELKRDIKENPQNYTYWFKLILSSRNFNKLKFRQPLTRRVKRLD